MGSVCTDPRLVATQRRTCRRGRETYNRDGARAVSVITFMGSLPNGCLTRRPVRAPAVRRASR